MPDSSAELAAIPAAMREALLLCAQGGISANVGLMRLLIYAADPAQARDALARTQAVFEQSGEFEALRRLQAVAQLWAATPEAWTTVRQVIGCMPHDPSAGGPNEIIAQWATAFDRAADRAGDTGVALYALGRADLLEAATNEVIAALPRWGAAETPRRVLEIGCGSGRFLEKLAAAAELAVGIDVSQRMLRRARDRCVGVTACFVQTTGRDLALFRDRSFDLVLAADVFPYIVSAGLADLYAAEAARVLEPNGILLILNYTYRGDQVRDREDVAALAIRHDYSILRDGTRDLKYWDASAYVLQRRPVG